MQQDALLKLLHHRLRISVVGFLEVAGDIVHPTPVSQWHHDALIHVALGLIHLFDDGLGYCLYTLCTTVETLNHCLEGILGELFAGLVDILITGEGHLHR